MASDFSRCLSLLRQERGVSQRAAAKDLGISQALLSHYENGVREPGLAFVVKACNYYHVSADFLLGRTLSRDGTTIVSADELYDYSAEKDNVLHGSIMATLNKKLLVNSVGVLFDLLGKTGSKQAISAAADYLGTAVYTMFRHLFRANGTQNEDFFSVPARHFVVGVPRADMICAEADYVDALATHAKGFTPAGPPTPAAPGPALCPPSPAEAGGLPAALPLPAAKPHGFAQIPFLILIPALCAAPLCGAPARTFLRRCFD